MPALPMHPGQVAGVSQAISAASVEDTAGNKVSERVCRLTSKWLGQVLSRSGDSLCCFFCLSFPTVFDCIFLCHDYDPWCRDKPQFDAAILPDVCEHCLRFLFSRRNFPVCSLCALLCRPFVLYGVLPLPFCMSLDYPVPQSQRYRASQPAVSFLSSAAPCLFPASTKRASQIILQRLEGQPLWVLQRVSFTEHLCIFSKRFFFQQYFFWGRGIPLFSTHSLSAEYLSRIEELEPDEDERTNVLVFERISPLLAMRVVPSFETTVTEECSCHLQELLEER